jgi:2,3-bisphosphoglycerate-dependent phosphoglycerate mutase
MKRVLFVRHAESANNHAHASLLAELGPDHPELEARSEAARAPDPELTGRGREQAARLAAGLAERTAGERVLLASSPMRRALHTALPVAEALTLDRSRFWCHAELYEVGGCYLGETVHPGATAAELEAGFPVTCHAFADNHGWFAGRTRPEHGVEAGQRVERVVRWIEATLAAPEVGFDTAIVIAHGDLLTRWLRRWLGVSWRTSLAFVHGNTGITELRWHPALGVLLLGLNDLGHLPPSLHSGSRFADAWWRYATPELVVDRHEGSRGVEPALWAAALALREAELLSREGTRIEDYRASDARSVHFLARVDGTLAGTAQYDPELDRLRQMVVARAFRHGRVGRALIDAARAEAARRGRDRLRVHAWSASEPFYRQVGFRRCGEVVRTSAMPWVPMELPAARVEDSREAGGDSSGRSRGRGPASVR